MAACFKRSEIIPFVSSYMSKEDMIEAIVILRSHYSRLCGRNDIYLDLCSLETVLQNKSLRSDALAIRAGSSCIKIAFEAVFIDARMGYNHIELSICYRLMLALPGLRGGLN